MKRFLQRLYRSNPIIPLAVRNTILLKDLMHFIFGMIPYIKNYIAFKRSANIRPELSVAWRDLYPCLSDNTGSSKFDQHYVYHTAWAARVLKETYPAKHIDISSYLYFSTIVSAFIPVEFYDYRPAVINLDHINASAGDLLNLSFADNSIASLSCMHVVEHIGLGRYGDPLDPLGDVKAIAELVRVLAVGGNLLFVVPVGAPRVMFNAHRIYAYEQIIRYFAGLTLLEFSLIPDDDAEGRLIRHADPARVQTQQFACGCFWFVKPGE